MNPIVVGTPVEIDVSAVSQRILVGHIGTPGQLVQVRIVNDGTATAWFRGGDSTVTVTATAAQANTGMRALSGTIEVQSFTLPANGDLWIAAIAAGATGKIEFAPCFGV